MRSGSRLALLAACFFLSGASGLAYETAWSQQLGLVFGATELAVVAVLAAYMAGLAAGAVVAGRWASRVERPFLAYALLELAIAASALAVPGLIALAGRLHVALFSGTGAEASGGGAALSLLFRFAASFVVLGVPTACMGATLPLLVRGVVSRAEDIGRRTAALYAANTMGAAAGALAAGFLLLPRLGLGRTFLGAAALNLCAALLALPLLGDRPPKPELPASAPESGRRWILPLALVSGFVSFGLEVAWTRLLAFVVGGSIYAFATMLTTFLAGIGIGSALASPLARSVEAARRGFVLAQLGAAAFALLALRAVEYLPVCRGTDASPAGLLVCGVLAGAVTLLPTAACFGAAFPFAVRVLAGEARDAAPASARVFAWNTVGCVAGAIAAGLWALPALRVEGTIAAAAAISLSLAAIASVAPPRPVLRVPAALAVASAVALVFVRPPAPWKTLARESLPGSRERRDVITFYAAGRSATVLLHDLGREWRLTSNGLPESAIQRPGGRSVRYAVAEWLTLLPLALRPEAGSVLVVGLGAGKSVEAVPSAVRTIDVVELEPAVVDANRSVAAQRRRDPLSDPRVRLRLDDARTLLTLDPRRYDVVVSQPSHPWTAGSAHLFTREFFELVQARLAPRGVLSQWMGHAFIDEELFRCLLSTLLAVFRHVEVYSPPRCSSMLFLASDEPLEVGAEAGVALARDRQFWKMLGVRGEADLLLARVLDSEGSRRVARGSPVNTDQYNVLQIRSPLILASPLSARGADRILSSYDPLPTGREPDRDLLHARRLLEGRDLPRARRVVDRMAPSPGRELAALLVGAAARGRPPSHDELARLAMGPPRSTEAFRELLRLRAGVPSGMLPDEVISELLAEDPEAALIVEGWKAARSGNSALLREMDRGLAATSPESSLWEYSVRLRIAWRNLIGDEGEAREGLELVDELLAATARPADLLVRASLALRAGDRAAAIASLAEVAELQRGPGEHLPELRERARRLIATLPDDPETREIRRQLEAPARPRKS